MKRLRSKPRPAIGGRNLLSAELPGPAGRPLCGLYLEVSTLPQGDGERLRLRAHLHTTLGNAVPPRPRAGEDSPSQRLPAPASGGLPVRRVAAALLRRGFGNPLIGRLAAPLLRHDFHTWIDLHASTAPLLRGVAAMMPQATEKLRQIGVELPAGDGPLARTWAGESGGSHPGFAQFSLLRFDHRHLPPVLTALLGGRPFQVVAAVGNVMERRADPE